MSNLVQKWNRSFRGNIEYGNNNYGGLNMEKKENKVSSEKLIPKSSKPSRRRKKGCGCGKKRR